MRSPSIRFLIDKSPQVFVHSNRLFSQYSYKVCKDHSNTRRVSTSHGCPVSHASIQAPLDPCIKRQPSNIYAKSLPTAFAPSSGPNLKRYQQSAFKPSTCFSLSLLLSTFGSLQPGQKLAFASLCSSLAIFSFLKIQNTTASTATKLITVTRIEAIVRADQSLAGFEFVYGELGRGKAGGVAKMTTVAVGAADIVTAGVSVTILR